jgi:hypothetical protein
LRLAFVCFAAISEALNSSRFFKNLSNLRVSTDSVLPSFPLAFALESTACRHQQSLEFYARFCVLVNFEALFSSSFSAAHLAGRLGRLEPHVLRRVQQSHRL